MKNLLAVAMLCLAVPAGAIDLGLRYTSGNQGYKGMNAYAVLPVGDLTLRPAMDTVKNDGLNDTFKNYSLRAGVDTSILGFGAVVGTTPKVDGYTNTSYGGDVTATLSATGGGKKRIRSSGGGAPRGKGLARLDVGGGVLITNHEDDKTAAGTTRASTRKLTQTDINLFAGANIIGFNVSANLSNSSYDKTLTGSDRSAPRLAIEGINTRLFGFPESSLTLHAEAPFLPLINPFVTLNTTSFKGGAKSKTVGAGVYVGLEMLEAYASLERTSFDSSTAKDENTIAVGGALRFGIGD